MSLSNFKINLLAWLLLLVTLQNRVFATKGLLYPRESETRDVHRLDGIWNFVKIPTSNPDQAVQEKWFENDILKLQKDIIPMPVPASYNDITEDDLRDHYGTVWYERKFFVPRKWETDRRIWIRFSSVRYQGQVWINGQFVIKHDIGHLPFEAEITDKLNFGGENRINVQVDNRLNQTTIPMGNVAEVIRNGQKTIEQEYIFDFFHYSGIHRSVFLHTTPATYIEDVSVTTDLLEQAGNRLTGFVHYEIQSAGEIIPENVRIQIRDKNGEIVANQNSTNELSGLIQIEDVKPWWPYLMDPQPAYLYTMEIFLNIPNQPNADIYRLKIGIRTLYWDNKSFLLNGRPLYLRGFAKHEDSNIHGKGHDYPLLAKDFNLIQWTGANAFRTAHYPYSEETMNLADEYGIMVVNECPAVNMENYTEALLENHKSSIEQLIHRDKNHPSVILWSIANEPRSWLDDADSYFKSVAELTKSLDPTRPITAALMTDIAADKAASYLDVISFNTYHGWFLDTGDLNSITKNVYDEVLSWHSTFNKPVIVSEYGADSIEGTHVAPSFVWSEEYQAELMERHFMAFDKLRRNTEYFVGEFIWCFADLKTGKSTTRVNGNRQGIFTRDRQPKTAAHLLRKRYFTLAEDLYKSDIPNGVFSYISDSNTGRKLARDISEL